MVIKRMSIHARKNEMSTGLEVLIVSTVLAATGVGALIAKGKRKLGTKISDSLELQDATSTPRDLQPDSDVKPPIVVVTPDSRALTAIDQHSFTKLYLKLVGMSEGPKPNLRLDTGALKGVQDAADSWDDFNTWLATLVAACPDGEISLLVPCIGDEYTNADMLCFTEEKIVTMALAKVTKVLAHGLRRADGTVILPALVEASDKPNKS